MVKIKSSFECGLLALCVLVLAAPISAQTKPQKPAEEQDDVIRVSTVLVQTDVMVFDKKGHFVDGLKGDQFALKVDNKPTSISFFERVTSGKESTTRNPGATPSASSSGAMIVRGRTVIFFVDDLHLAPDSLVRTRKALLEFIERGMTEKDQVAITSSSGQIGFLQQFTDDKVALQSAVARLNYRANTKMDMDSPPMSEYIASKIRDGDQQTINYYVKELEKQNCFRPPGGGGMICMMTPQGMVAAVRMRAQEMTVMAAPDTDNTLIMLEGLMRTAGQLPGRKLVFMISDGFYLNDRKSGSLGRIKRITDAAGKAGVVIYTLDARGIIGDSLGVTNNRPIDSEGQTAGSTIGEIAASQDGLNALAGDTGGKAFRNTNAPMSEWVDKVLDETANYYLVAWRPDTEEQKRGKFNHIEASVIGRPDLTVRLRSAYFKSAPLPFLSVKRKTEKDPTKAREDDMRTVIDAPVNQTQIPTKLGLFLAQMPGVGTQVIASVEINREALSFDLKDGKQSADLDIGGIFYDDKGKPVNSFVGRLRIFPVPEDAPPEKRKQAIYAFRAWLPPGLYQVRVGIRDLNSGRLGSAMQFIQVPKVAGR
ncbi:MAG TPA: VWA domain-containing protein [Pyrinomonadaceae bacterium]|nr:VWA domain-containing protein [Pyrinomonadaceae bacterium]